MWIDQHSERLSISMNLILKLHLNTNKGSTRNFSGQGEVSLNKGTKINIPSATHERKIPQG